MAEPLFARLQSMHERIKREASGSIAKYARLLGIRVIIAIVGKRFAYRCYYTLQYFRSDDLILWYALYWIVVCRILIKTRLAKVFVKQRTPS